MSAISDIDFKYLGRYHIGILTVLIVKRVLLIGRAGAIEGNAQFVTLGVSQGDALAFQIITGFLNFNQAMDNRCDAICFIFIGRIVL